MTRVPARESTIKLSAAVIKHTESTEKSPECKHTHWTTLSTPPPFTHTDTHTQTHTHIPIQRGKHSLQTTVSFFFTPHFLFKLKLLTCSLCLCHYLSLSLSLSLSHTHKHTHTHFSLTTAYTNAQINSLFFFLILLLSICSL